VTAIGTGVSSLVDELVGDEGRYGTTYAVVIVHEGRTVHERYGGALPHFDRPPTPVTPSTPLLSWSMAKSILHAAVGILVERGVLRLDDPAPVPEWQRGDDPRRDITLEQLLTMRDGLAFVEDYVDGGISNVIDMLFGTGQDDVAAYAAARPLRHVPGTVFNYSSGTSNIVARIVGDAVGGGEQRTRAFLDDSLFGPAGMTSADPRFDAAGTWVGSSYVYATANDFARFGQLYLDGGVAGNRRVLSEGWVQHARRVRSVDEDGTKYGAHWWVMPDETAYWASGYEGQSILIAPDLDLVVVRLGKSTLDQRTALGEWRTAVVAAGRGA
jgi:CubicO group peptidase (beta-lactamase class C family)